LLKWIGIIFIMTATGYAGYQFSAGMKRRCKVLRQLLYVLQILQNEIIFCGTPLPQAFALVAVSTDGLWERVFARMAREMDHKKWLSPLAALEDGLHEDSDGILQSDTKDTLLELASGLGKYDHDSQVAALETARIRLSGILESLERERSIRGKTYGTLGICAGLSLVILLI